MGFGKPNISLDDVPAIVTAKPPKIPAVLKNVMLSLVGVGVVSFFIAVAKDPNRGWTSFQVSLLFFLILSAASSGFSAVFQITNAEWSRPLRRMFESASGYLLYAAVPLVIVYLFHGYHHIFQWAHHEVHGKELWLNPHFLFLRDLAGILLLIWVTKRVINLGLAQDLIAIRSGLTGVNKDELSRWQDKSYDKFVADWSGDPKVSIQQTFARKGFLSPVVVIAYATIFSLIAWDQIMSVEPHWFSTLFGPWIFMSGVYLTMAFNGMGVTLARSIHPLFKQKIIRPTLHDLGKLLFGFGIFWTYLFWSHYLTFWYGNLPEETGWVITRWRNEPWHSLSWFAFWCLFFFPFLFGLSKDVKQVPPLLFFTSAVVALGIWLMLYIMVVPGMFPTSIPLSFLDLGIFGGFLGVFVLLALRYLERVPLIPFGDLYR
jgi:hypothetical protein